MSYLPGKTTRIAERFRSYLPVVVDVETGGFNPATDALLEIAAVIINMDQDGKLIPGEVRSSHVIPFENANLEPKSLEINGIDPWHPLRAARKESDALGHIFKPIRQAISDSECTRAVLVGHNAFFDLSFINAAVKRTGIKRNPFHPFSNFDTVSLAGLAYGQTVLAKASEASGIKWNNDEAHSAVYDTLQTATLFCNIVNYWESLHQ